MIIDHKIIVIGSSINSLGVAKSLLRKKISFKLLSTNKGITFNSKLLSNQTILMKNYKEIINYIKQKSQFHDLYIFATSDLQIYYFYKSNLHLNKRCHFSSGDLSIAYKLINKEKLYELCRMNNIESPTTFTDFKDFLLNQKKYNIKKVILKPKYNFYKKLGFPYGTYLIDFKKSYSKKTIENIVKLQKFYVLQEFLELDEYENYGIYTINNGAKFISLSYYKIRSLPPGKGVGTALKISSNYKLSKWSSDFLDKIGYKGIADIEIFSNKKKDKNMVLDFNPRTGQMNYFSTKLGLNFPSFLIDNHIGLKSKNKVPKVNDEVATLDVFDIYSILKYYPKDIFCYLKLFVSKKLIFVISDSRDFGPLKYLTFNFFKKRH